MLESPQSSYAQLTPQSWRRKNPSGETPPSVSCANRDPCAAQADSTSSGASHSDLADMGPEAAVACGSGVCHAKRLLPPHAEQRHNSSDANLLCPQRVGRVGATSDADDSCVSEAIATILKLARQQTACQNQSSSFS